MSCLPGVVWNQRFYEGKGLVDDLFMEQAFHAKASVETCA